MAVKTKTREITIIDDKGTFSTFFKRFYGEREEYDFKALSELRKLFSNERARILHAVKTKQPKSIYHLAKILGRTFKSVSEDIKLLEKFGFIDLIREKTGKRERIKPVIIVDSIKIEIKV
jgi:predicted transcriptional regulator